MRQLNLKIVTTSIALLAVVSWAQRPYYLLPGVHPGYSLVNMKPATSTSGQLNVGAMTWLPDGRLFVAAMSTNTAGGAMANRLGATTGFILSGIPTATTNSTVTMQAVGGGYQMPTGATNVGDTIYVVDNDSGLTKLTPNGSGGYVKSVVYSGVLGNLPVLTESNGTTMHYSHRSWVGGVVYKDGFLYANVGMGLIPGGTSEFVDAYLYRGKGTILKISKTGQVVDTVAGGVRNPVSLEIGPEGEIFYADNQGSFMPASGLFHVKPGRFYGHLKTPFADRLSTPPAIIFPYGTETTGGSGTAGANNPTVSRVATGSVQLKTGRFAGQLLIGSNPQNGINRIFMEKVGGEFQGALFPFSQGFGVGQSSGGASTSLPGVLAEFRANVHRLSIGPDGHIYVGGGNSPGGPGSGSHGIDAATGGLARLVPNNDSVFEMKAIRSLNSTQLEVEFTEPVVSVATSNFAVGQGVSVRATTTQYGITYGSLGSMLAVTAATLNTDKTKATLTITGLKERPATTTPGSVEDRTWGSLIQVRVTGVNAVSGRTMWGAGTAGGGVGWYTLNKFGPGEDAGGAVSVTPSTKNFQGIQGLTLNRTSAGLHVQAPVNGRYALRVSDLRGKTIATFSVESGSFLIPAASLGGGVNVLEAKASNGQRWMTAVPKL